ncbi:response regulator transcription factor [Chitinophaga polysaccharea]|uniref:response regulator transcription factor n=1 Tax=Chitinophaga TaxID=79328 RepID=UPI00145554BF|nr:MULTISPECIES: response regulator transcription factor [Chitinophaga]NLR58692.1 response regulator transcription factor [Chitinophaga polysaccharea]NLU91220.1 response regulator transcription factor [Chitinophaga sp. Ak27]
MSTVNILIADDHPIFLKGLKEVVEAGHHLQVIYQAANGQDAIQGVATKLVDVVILDIDMPVKNGLQAAVEILQLKPEMPVILLTMHKAKDAFLKALDIGVMGYVLKENAVVDVMYAIEAVLRGHSYISPEMTSFLLAQKRSRQPVMDNVTTLLTSSEIKILKMVGEYKSTKEIADELYISEKTVSNHRMNITKKLQLTGKNSLLRFAIEWKQ